MFGELLGADLTNRQNTVFGYIARLLMLVPGATLYTFLEFMKDPEAVKPYLPKLHEGAQDLFQTELLSSNVDPTRAQIRSRLWGVFQKEELFHMFTHETNKLDMFSAMNRGSLILINTAKGFLKDDSKLFGRFFIALVAQATSERYALPEDKRFPTFVYIDEAQDYFDERLLDFVNSARKQKVGLIIAHQNLDQLTTRKLRNSIITSTAIKFAGGASDDDCRELAPNMHTEWGFIHAMQKFPTESHFAVWVKDRTPTAVEFSVPLGSLERLPKMSAKDYQRLLAENHARYCAPLRSDVPSGSAAIEKSGATFDLEDPTLI